MLPLFGVSSAQRQTSHGLTIVTPVFIPVMEHWVLLVILPLYRQYYLLDSLQSVSATTHDIVRILLEKIDKFYCQANDLQDDRPYMLVEVESPFYQNDAAACGLCTILNAVLVTKLGQRAVVGLDREPMNPSVSTHTWFGTVVHLL